MRTTLLTALRGCRCVVVALAVAALGFCGSARAATDGSYQDVYWVNSCSLYDNTAPVFSPDEDPSGFTFADGCTPGGGWSDALELEAVHTAVGSYSEWSAETPSPAIRIIGADTPPQTGNPVVACTLSADGFAAAFFWGDDGVNYGTKPITQDCHGSDTGMLAAGGIDQYIQSSRYFGWDVSCNTNGAGGIPAECTGANSSGFLVLVSGISLEVQETTGPALTALGDNLWNQSGGWVRGSWPVNLGASDPSGVCGMEIQIDGSVLNANADWSPDTSQWQQCNLTEVDGNVDTTSYPSAAGSFTLGFSATNAAGAVSSLSQAIDVDNVTPTITLAGPSDALASAGTQFVTADAAAGPSGIRAIYCSTDGGAYEHYAGPSAQVPVSGLGAHTVDCYAQNNAVDADGQYATSSTASLSMQIRQPTAEAVSFSRIVDALRCRRVTVRVPGRVRTITRHGHPVQVRGRAHTRTLTRCHARTVRRLVRVTVVRHGRKVAVWRARRVVLLPHLVQRSSTRVGFGKATTVSGWLGLTDGVPLGGRTVQILTAPDNGLLQFSSATTVQTSPEGLWTAEINPGPSRLIEAVYAGDATTEPATSAPVTLTVPAKVELLRITPRRVPWGGTVRISGRVLGGYLPPSGALLRLRIGLGSAVTTYGVHEHVTGSGRFTTVYTFGVGPAVIHRRFWFEVSTLPIGDYPYAPANSRRLAVAVGGHPSTDLCCRSR